MDVEDTFFFPPWAQGEVQGFLVSLHISGGETGVLDISRMKEVVFRKGDRAL